MGYSIVNVEDIEGAGSGGAVRFVRRELGCEAFGINWFELAPGAAGLEHDETGTGQEEVNVVIAGSGVWKIDGEEVPVRAGTFRACLDRVSCTTPSAPRTWRSTPLRA
jgi:quercetin dioxygenase-like cupin family protein